MGQDKKDYRGSKSPNYDQKGSKSRKDFNKQDTNYNYGRNSKGKPSTHINDYTWYVMDDKIGESTYNIPFNVFPGTREVIAESINSYEFVSTPGVMRLRYASIPGTSTSGVSAINVAARAIYTFVRHQNSGHTNYEAPDLMIYILTMMEIYSHYFEACRIYKTAMTYTFTNRYVPDTLLEAMGANPVNIRQNIAQYRAGLNVIAAKISSMAVPDVFTSVLRSVYLASNIFGDSDSIRGQYYVPTLNMYRKFDPTLPNGGGLVNAKLGVDNRSYMSIINNLNSLIDVVLADEDMNIMSGDILKAYGKEKCYTLSMISEADTINPVYDENFMSQIENAFIMPIYDDFDDNDYDTSFNVTQFDGTIRCNGLSIAGRHLQVPGIKMASEVLKDRVYFNSHRENPTWKDVVDWSRFMLCEDTTDADEGRIYYSSGSEVLLAADIYYMKYYSDTAGSEITHYNFSSVMPDTAAEILCLISQFDWHPIIYLYRSTLLPSGETTHRLVTKMGDLKVYTLVSADVIKRMNETAVLGEFGRQLALFLK